MIKVNLKYSPAGLHQFTEDMKALALLSEHYAVELHIDAELKEE